MSIESVEIESSGLSGIDLVEVRQGPAASVDNTNVNAAIADDPAASRLALEIPIDNFAAVLAPTVNNDSSGGYSQGSKWYDTVTGEAYVCVDATVGAAIWIKTTLTVDELGSAAFTESSAYATAAQGTTADTASQPGHTHVSADVTDATNAPFSNPEKLIKTDPSGDIIGDLSVVGNMNAGSYSGYGGTTPISLLYGLNNGAGGGLNTPSASTGTIALTNDSRFTDERVPTAAGLTSKFGTNKATLADGDKVTILDSADSDAPKHGLFSLVKSTLANLFVKSETTGITGADRVTNIVSLTQAEYDAIGSPDASTLYIITD